VAGVDDRPELRRGDEVVATRHLSRGQPLEVGDRIEVGGQSGIVPGNRGAAGRARTRRS
jgi:hypothetical protein